MPDIDRINRFLQRELSRRDIDEAGAVEANSWLDRAGLLRDSAHRPGKPLRDLLRARTILGQHQYPNRRWAIRRVQEAESKAAGKRGNPKGALDGIGPKARAFSRLLQRYDKLFSKKGSFRLKCGENLRECIHRNDVPEVPAAYLIYAVRRRRAELLYIGKSGTMRTDGTLKNQGLATRLRMKQGKQWRGEFYEEEMRRRRLSGLEFRWWVTVDRNVRILPAWAEAQLFQAYFDDNRRLPPWNLAV